MKKGQSSRGDKFVLNIPNALSLYRLLMFPVILIIALRDNESLFVWLFCINLITDILDGLIARKFDMATEYGAKLDSIADIGTFILAFIGIYLFKYVEFTPHVYSFGLFIVLFVLSQLLPVVRFGRFPSFHLYSWKIGGYIQGTFFFVLFVFDFNVVFYYIMVTWGILAFLEHLTIQFIIKEMASNLKGLYWVLKSQKN